MAYNVNNKATVGHLKALALRAKAAVEEAVAALPVEMFLDAAKTTFVQKFAFSTESYPGATDPKFDNKPVLVLAMNSKDNVTGNVTTNYSFLNMESLVDTYKAKSGTSAKILNISGYEIEVKIDPATHNKLSVTNNGLMVNTRISGATNGNIVTTNANGDIQDGGIAAGSIVTAIQSPTNGNIVAMNTNGKIVDGGILAANIVTKVANATNGHLAALNANGELTDSGVAISDVVVASQIATDAEVTEMLNEVFGAAV